MKHLIVFAHPNTHSLNAQLKNALVEHLQHLNHIVQVRDLYQINFNPVLSFEDIKRQRQGQVVQEVSREQDYIKWADHITFIHPIWWTGLPAILKGYIDRVFSYGFAYQYVDGVQQGLLEGKQVVVINTHGKSASYYIDMGMLNALSLTSDTGIYTYAGLTLNKHFFFDQADRASGLQIENWKQQIINQFNS